VEWAERLPASCREHREWRPAEPRPTAPPRPAVALLLRRLPEAGDEAREIVELALPPAGPPDDLQATKGREEPT
jgi:hypothetical protein